MAMERRVAKTNYEKMQTGELSNYKDAEIVARNSECARLMRAFNATGIDMEDEWRKALHALIPHAHPTAVVKPPFICDFGTEIFLAEDVFINYNCTFLDGGGIRIGARTLIAPDCKFYTPNHPMDYLERREPYERSLGITVGEDCWIGGGSVICPGVTIGNRVVVAAGSVVVDDVPDDVLVAGNPAVVKRRALSPLSSGMHGDEKEAERLREELRKLTDEV